MAVQRSPSESCGMSHPRRDSCDMGVMSQIEVTARDTRSSSET